MRILLVNTYPTRVHWGVEVVVENIMNGLRSRGHKPELVCLSDAELAVLQTIRFPEKFLINALLMQKVARKAGSFDLLHFQAYNSYIAKYVRSKPRVVTLHGSSFGLHERVAHTMSKHRLAYSRHVIERMEREGARTCDAVVAVSSAVRSEAIRGYGISPSKISVVNNAVILDKRRRPQAELRRELGIHGGYPLLMTVTRGDYTKGTDMLVQIGEKLNRETGAQMLVVGNIPHSLRRDWMHFARPKHADIWRYYQCADVYLNTSRYEGFGLAMLEAMGYGIPTISFNIGISPEAIQSGKNGYLVNRYDTVDYCEKAAKLIGDDSLRRKMGNAAAATVKSKFSINRMIDGYLKVYESVLRPRK